MERTLIPNHLWILGHHTVSLSPNHADAQSHDARQQCVSSSGLPERPGGAVVWTWVYWEFSTFPLVMQIQNTAFAILKNASRGKPSNTGTLKTRVWDSQLLKNWECFSFLKWRASLWLYVIHRVPVYLPLHDPLEASLRSKYKVLKPPTFTNIDSFPTLELFPFC